VQESTGEIPTEQTAKKKSKSKAPLIDAIINELGGQETD
jgi:hypothetical protein